MRIINIPKLKYLSVLALFFMPTFLCLDMQAADYNDNGDGINVQDRRCRECILDFIEQLRTAYNTRNLDFIEAVLGDGDSTNHGMERQYAGCSKHPSDSILQENRKYLSILNKIFNKNNPVNVTFDDIKIKRHFNDSKIYDLTLHQKLTSGVYQLSGFICMLWDFTDERKSSMHVWKWIPDTYNEDGRDKTCIDEYCLFDDNLCGFDIYLNELEKNEK